MKKKRLDEVIIARGEAKDKNEAFIRITGGTVFINGRKAVSPAEPVFESADIKIIRPPKYVGRGALKLEAALDKFSIFVTGKVCADIGAATGGFTDVLLKRGAKKVYAVDVGRGKLALKLREDARVAVMEQTNILYLDTLPEPIDCAAVDVSFTSLRLVLPALKKFLAPAAEVIALFKPQYEVKETELRHGIVESVAARRAALQSFRAWVLDAGWTVTGEIESPIKGAKGNTEYLFRLAPP